MIFSLLQSMQDLIEDRYNNFQFYVFFSLHSEIIHKKYISYEQTTNFYAHSYLSKIETSVENYFAY